MYPDLEVLPALYTTGTFPPLAVRNHGLRMGAVIEELQQRDITAIVDVGCGDGVLAQKISESSLGVDRYVGVDAWAERVTKARENTQLAEAGFDFVQGSMTDLRHAIERPELYRDHGAVVMLETIEHVPLLEVPNIQEGVFGYIAPEVVVVTTPDATVRLTDEKLGARGHHFEWNIDEFESWAESTGNSYGYEANVRQLTGPTFVRNTQIAVFEKIAKILSS